MGDVDVGAVPFRLEADLLGPVSEWLRGAGFDVRVEVPILGHRADLVGSRPDGVAAVEMKLHDWSRALRQAMSYQIAADWAWVAMPLASASRAYREGWRFASEGIGLLAVDDRGRVRVPIAAGLSPRLLPFLRDKVRAAREVGAGAIEVETAAVERLPGIADDNAVSGRAH